MLGGILNSSISFSRAERQLTSLIQKINPKDSLLDQVLALRRIILWLDKSAPIESPSGDKSAVLNSRLDFLFKHLDNNNENRALIAKTIRRIITEASAFDLFCLTGLPSGESLSAELLNRFFAQILPRAPDPHDLRDLLSILFPSNASQKWLRSMSPSSMEKISLLLLFEANESPFQKMNSETCDSILYLAAQIQTLGLDPHLRPRMESGKFRDSPFYELNLQARIAVDLVSVGESSEAAQLRKTLKDTIEACRNELRGVHHQLSQTGVSVSVVYQIERTSALLTRIEDLLAILLSPKGSRSFGDFFSDIIADLVGRRNFKALFSSTFSLLSKKIAEQNAETGDHYIARTRKNYFAMLRSAMGGGIVTAFTATAKIFIEGWHFSYFIKGALASTNYASSFVLIQLCGFTLGTKQPAMTAHALAEKMKTLKDPGTLNGVTSETISLLRSQIISVLGNVIAVIPGVLLIDFYFFSKQSQHFLSTESAQKIIIDHSILGISPLAAVWTGVLLWFSSILAGWIDNWSRYKRIHIGISEHYRLKRILGRKICQKVGNFYARNISGFAGNISLGILLGMSPKIGSFFGIATEVRHVTLASGALAMAFAESGIEVLKTSGFWLAAIGIFAIGIINVAVSFGLALMVAMRARDVQKIQRQQILRSLYQAFKKNPLAWFGPPPKDQSISDLH